MTSSFRIVVVMAVLLAPAAARAQEKAINNASNNGIPQQIAALQQQLVQAKEAISRLVARLDALDHADMELRGLIDAEAMARMGADDMLQMNVDVESMARQSADLMLQGGIDVLGTGAQDQESRLLEAIRAIHLPQYLIEPGVAPPPEDTPPVDSQ